MLFSLPHPLSPPNSPIAGRSCIGCAATITLCNGFTLARDIFAGGPIRELCWKCAVRCENDPALLDILTEGPLL
jgi:hypothetical protein